MSRWSNDKPGTDPDDAIPYALTALGSAAAEIADIEAEIEL